MRLLGGVSPLLRAGEIWGVSRWTPAALFAAGQQGVWLEASPTYKGDQVLWQQSDGTIIVNANGDPVGRDDDLSPNGNNATQPTSADRPLYQTDGSLHWLEFDGAGDYLLSSYATLLPQPCTLSIALDRKDLSTSVVFAGGATLDNRHQIGINLSGVLYVFAGASLEHNQNLSVGKHVVTAIINGAESSLRIDGVEIKAGNAGALSSDGLSLSAQATGAQSTDMSIFGAVHVEGINHVSEVENYLAKRAGITL